MSSILSNLYEEGFNPFIASGIPQTVKTNYIKLKNYKIIEEAVHSFDFDKVTYFNVKKPTPFGKVRGKILLTSIDNFNRKVGNYLEELIKINFKDFSIFNCNIDWDSNLLPNGFDLALKYEVIVKQQPLLSSHIIFNYEKFRIPTGLVGIPYDKFDTIIITYIKKRLI
jgi:hypothetical protein